jgi:hypothetical protein
MKNTIAFIILLAVATCAPGATRKKAASPAPAPQAVTIPKDAVPNADGTTFLYTDKQGKKWTYAKTPFGIMKSAYSDTAAAAAPAADAGLTKAIDKGDTVRFERPGPFGIIAWEKKKAELTDDERHTLESQNTKSQFETQTAKPQ